MAEPGAVNQSEDGGPELHSFLPLVIVLGCFGFALYWSKAHLVFNVAHQPGKACIAAVVGFVIGVMVSIGDDGGLGEL